MTVGDKCSRCNKCLKKKSIDENTIKKPVTEKRPRVKQHLVYDIDEDDNKDWEPYMSPLKKFFSDASVVCTMAVELPWKKIAVPKRIRIRRDTAFDDEDNLEEKVESEDSDPNIKLPWGNLVVTKTVKIKEPKAKPDEALKIPWEDLVLESSLEIKPEESGDEPCSAENIEMPWEEMLIPQNIKIKKQRPSIYDISGKPPVRKVKKTCCLKAKQMRKL